MKQTTFYALRTFATALTLAGFVSGCGAQIQMDATAPLTTEPEPSGEILDPAEEQPQSRAPGGPAQLPVSGCMYKDVPGTATIAKVTPASAGENNCPNKPMNVTFQFKADDGGSTESENQLTIGDGKNPPRSWIVASGLTEGSVHKCIRQELVEGACPPVVFDFPDLDQGQGRTECFAMPE